MTTVDARGLSCPLPLTMARRKLEDLPRGDRLLVMATDPEAGVDLAAYAADEGHGFEELAGDPGWAEYVLTRGG